MKLNTKKRLAALFLLLATICFVLEKTFYGDISAQGVLQESFFLPLGAILLMLGLIFSAWFVLQALFQTKK